VERYFTQFKRESTRRNMKATGIVVLIYGILLCFGGLMGFIKANSMISLIMGFLFGVIAIASAIVLLKGNRKGAFLALILSIVLDAFFTYRYLHTGHFIPSGLMSILSLVVILFTAKLLRKAQSKHKINGRSRSKAQRAR
jgi:uncharacterized membrane protein (UPF0136 family)